MNRMLNNRNNARERRPGERGLSLIEIVVALAIIGTIAAFAVPQLSGTRRAMRAAGLPRDLTSQLRSARQFAISRNRAVTFQLDVEERSISILQHEDGLTGTDVLNEVNYPETAGHEVVRQVPMAAWGASADTITYGKPAAATKINLDDDTELAPLVDNKVNITFQPDGSVLNANGTFGNLALFLYDSYDENNTASAVSILGASGRIKIWRYQHDDEQFVE